MRVKPYKKGLAALLALLLCFSFPCGSLFSQNALAAPADGTVNLTNKSLLNPENAFDTYSVDYIMDPGTKAVNLTLSLVLNDYLNNKLEGYTDEGQVNAIGSETEQQYCDYLDGLAGDPSAGIAPVTFQLKIDPTTLELLAGQPTGPMDITTDVEIDSQTVNNMKIGSYEWDTAAGVLTGTLLPRVYYLQDVTFGLTTAVIATDTSNVGSSIDAFNVDDSGMITIDFAAPTEDEKDPPVNYTIDKTVNYSDGNEFINYTITAEISGSAPADASLDGKWVLDNLPADLVYTKAEVDLDNAGSPVDILNPQYVTDGTKLAYQFSGAIKTATFTLTAALTDDIMTELVKNNTEFTKTYSNTAQLSRDEEGDNLIQESQTVDADMALGSFFTKEGKPSATDNRVYNWTITVNSYGTAADAYIADVINGDMHEYVPGSLKINGNDLAFTSSGSNFPKNYSELNHAYLQADDSAFPLSPTTYTTSTPDEILLLIPFQSYIGQKNVVITYQTRINNDAGSVDSNNKVKNNAKLIWKDFTYRGIGPNDWDFDFDIGKSYSPDTNIVKKAGGTYNPATQEMTWNFTINAYQTDIEMLDITDMFTDSDQELLINTTPGSVVQLTLDETTTTIDVPYSATPGNPNTNYYTIEQNDGKTTFTLHLGTGIGTDRYTFSLNTKVKNTDLITDNKTSFSLKNSMTAKTKINSVPDPVEQTVNASKSVNNAILSKKAIGSYHYAANSVEWELTVNQNQVPIQNATLEDTLPVGTHLGDTVSINSTPYTLDQLKAGVTDFNNKITFDTQSIQNADGYTEEVLTISIDGTLAEKYTISYDTVFEENYRRDNFVTGMSPPEIPNTCSYVPDSTVYDSPVVATADAKHTLTVPPMTKKGQYVVVDNNNKASYGGDDMVGAHLADWTIMVNLHQVDIGGATVTDTLPEHFELLPSSFVISVVTSLNADGSIGAANPVTDIDVTFENGFQFSVPAKYAHDTLAITFRTLVSSEVDVPKEKMTNQASLEFANGDAWNTGDVQADNAKDFDYSDYASASTAPTLNVYKTSSSLDNHGQPYLTLDGAEFEVVAVKNDGSIDPASKRVKSTIRNGKATFMFLSRNQAYQLTETKAPAGYALDETPYYFCFGSLGITIPGISNIQEFLNRIGEMTLSNTPIDLKGAAPMLTVEKHSPDGQPMSGVTFALTDGSMYEEIDTDASGLAKFGPLDPGNSYTLTETLPSECDTAGAVWDISVSYDAVSGYVISAGPQGDALTELAGNLVITNSYKGAVVILDGMAQDENGQLTPKQDAEFTIYHNGDPVGYLIWDPAENAYVPSIGTNHGAGLTKNDYGSFCVQEGKLLSGGYTYAMTKAPVGYLDNDDAISFTAPDSGQLDLTVASGAFYLFEKDPNYNKFTVTFDSQGGSAVAPLNGVAKGSTIAKPTEPTYSGYEFTGWYTDAACTKPWNFAVDTVEKDITLYAGWHLIPDDNDGDDNNSNKVESNTTPPNGNPSGSTPSFSTPSSSSKESTLPDTGDSFPYLALAVIASLSLLGWGVRLSMRKKRRRNRS